MSVEVSNDKC
uniref:Uncharacterized protein n=1 Tax=Rhizophora mucronata TaxID=61149 RepID=A0A2P2P7A8_RHIMU